LRTPICRAHSDAMVRCRKNPYREVAVTALSQCPTDDFHALLHRHQVVFFPEREQCMGIVIDISSESRFAITSER